MISSPMIFTPHVIRQATYAIAMATAMVVCLSLGLYHGSRAKAEDLIATYEQGKKDALRLSPRPSMDLEMACVAIWANKVPVPEALR